jgi:hypothetical protein
MKGKDAMKENPFTSLPVRLLLAGFIVLALVMVAAAARADDCPRMTGLHCPGATVSASLIRYDCSASDGSNFDLWQFAGSAGDAITIDMASTAFTPYLILLDPADVPIAESETHIAFKLPSTGTYTVVANSLNASQWGNYTLSISCPVAASSVRRRAVPHGGL